MDRFEQACTPQKMHTELRKIQPDSSFYFLKSTTPFYFKEFKLNRNQAQSEIILKRIRNRTVYIQRQAIYAIAMVATATVLPKRSKQLNLVKCHQLARCLGTSLT